MTAVGYFRVLAGTTTWTCSVVEMSGSKQLSGLSLHIFRWALRFILKVFGRKPLYSTPATADRYCAKPANETEPPDCSFWNIKPGEVKGKGRRTLL
jgi:hypothetical protein